MKPGTDKVTWQWPSLYMTTTSFLADFALGMIILTMPLYALDLGASPMEIGAIGGAFALMYAVAPFFTGRLLRRFRGSRPMGLAMISYSGLILIYSLAFSPTILLLSRILEGLVWAVLWPALEVSASSLYKDAEKGLRRYNMAWSSGALSGPLVGGYLITYFGIKTPFYIAAGTAAFVGLLGLLLPTRRTTISKEMADHLSTPRLGELLRTIVSSPLFLSAFIVGLILTFFPPFATSRGLSPAEIGIIFFAGGLARTLSFAVVPYLRAKFGLEKILVISCVMSCLIPLLVLTEDRIWFYVSFSMLGGFTGIIYSMGLFRMVGRAREELRSTMAGVFEGTTGLGLFIGPIIGGFASGVNPMLAFILPSFLLFVPLGLWKSRTGPSKWA